MYQARVGRQRETEGRGVPGLGLVYPSEDSKDAIEEAFSNWQKAIQGDGGFPAEDSSEGEEVREVLPTIPPMIITKRYPNGTFDAVMEVDGKVQEFSKMYISGFPQVSMGKGPEDPIRIDVTISEVER